MLKVIKINYAISADNFIFNMFLARQGGYRIIIMTDIIDTFKKFISNCRQFYGAQQYL